MDTTTTATEKESKTVGLKDEQINRHIHVDKERLTG